MSADNESIQQLMEITGLDEVRAVTVFEMNNYNLEQAINYHLESSDFIDFPTNDSNSFSSLSNQESRTNYVNRGSSNGDTNKKRNSNDLENNDTSFVSENASLPDIVENSNGMFSSNLFSGINSDDNVRAPIPSKREQLLLPEEDQFRLHYSGARKRRPNPSNMFTFCPFRDFAREAQIQEELSEEFNTLAYGSGEPNGSTLGPSPFDYISASSSNSSENSGSSSSSNKRINSRHRKRSSNNNDNNEFDSKETEKSLSRSNKRKRLEDLFRPPIDLLFWGTFQSARDHATTLNRWLIVNLQDQREFKSQILNRDVWSDKDIKEIISSNFVLWQVPMENPEGLRFKTFYHVSECPYVCVIDPRTGEERLACDTTRPKILYDGLMKFLTENDFCLDVSLKVTKTTTSKTASSTATSNSISTIIPSSSTVTTNSKNNNLIKINCDNVMKLNTYKTLELSEEDQLELAIKNSLKETQTSISDKNKKDSNNILNSDEMDNFVSLNTSGESSDFTDYVEGASNSKDNNIKNYDISDIQVNNEKNEMSINNIKNEVTAFSYKDLIGNSKDPITKIQIRLPSGEREELEWPSSSVLKCLKLYVCEKYPGIAKETYKLIQSYPRKNILELADDMTLFDAKLHPTSILYLHPDE